MPTGAKTTRIPISHEEKHKKLRAIKKVQLDSLRASYGILNDKLRGKIAIILEKEFTKIKNMPEADLCACDNGEHVEVSFDEAIDTLSDGHGAVAPSYAMAVYAALGVEFNKKLIYHGYTDVFNFKGLHMADGQEGTPTVNTGDMSFDIADKLGVRESTGHYGGRGFQARAYSDAIRKKLKGE